MIAKLPAMMPTSFVSIATFMFMLVCCFHTLAVTGQSLGIALQYPEAPCSTAFFNATGEELFKYINATNAQVLSGMGYSIKNFQVNPVLTVNIVNAGSGRLLRRPNGKYEDRRSNSQDGWAAEGPRHDTISARASDTKRDLIIINPTCPVSICPPSLLDSFSKNLNRDLTISFSRDVLQLLRLAALCSVMVAVCADQAGN